MHRMSSCASANSVFLECIWHQISSGCALLGAFEKDTPFHTQEVAGSSPAAPTIFPAVSLWKDSIRSAFDRLFHPKPIRVGVYLACRRFA